MISWMDRYMCCLMILLPGRRILILFLHQSFLYLVWYTTMSILGHYNNFFFAAHLLDIAMGFKTLRTILSSVTHNGKQVWARRMQFFFPSSRGHCRVATVCLFSDVQPQASSYHSFHPPAPLMASWVTQVCSVCQLCQIL